MHKSATQSMHAGQEGGILMGSNCVLPLKRDV
jgi:hypothetical protein